MAGEYTAPETTRRETVVLGLADLVVGAELRAGDPRQHADEPARNREHRGQQHITSHRARSIALLGARST